MKQSEAILHLRRYMLALQKYRSNTALDIPDLSEESKAEMWPWIFGDKCPLPQLVKVVDRTEKGKSLDPHDYYNFMVILYRFTPEIIAAMNIMNIDNPMPDEQPPTGVLVSGWDEED